MLSTLMTPFVSHNHSMSEMQFSYKELGKIAIDYGLIGQTINPFVSQTTTELFDVRVRKSIVKGLSVLGSKDPTTLLDAQGWEDTLEEMGPICRGLMIGVFPHCWPDSNEDLDNVQKRLIASMNGLREAIDERVEFEWESFDKRVEAIVEESTTDVQATQISQQTVEEAFTLDTEDIEDVVEGVLEEGVVETPDFFKEIVFDDNNDLNEEGNALVDEVITSMFNHEAMEGVSELPEEVQERLRDTLKKVTVKVVQKQQSLKGEETESGEAITTSLTDDELTQQIKAEFEKNKVF